MLAFVSPKYFASEFCKREWGTFADYETDSLPPDSIAVIYLTDIPGLKKRTDKWTSDLMRRQYMDIRKWVLKDGKFMTPKDALAQVKELDASIIDKMKLAQVRASGPYTVPPHNKYFSGRKDELAEIHTTLAESRIGVITAVQGLAGMGKSALAFEYAHAYAHEYPGGCFLLPCAG